MGSRRVLVADDSAVARLSITSRVRESGLEIVESDSAASARAVDAVTLSCALLDFDLGDGDGADLASHLRRRAAELPIAFFTSTNAEGDRARASLFGPVFAKPDELDAAVEWVRRNA